MMRTALLVASTALGAASLFAPATAAAEPTVQECLTASNTSVALRTKHNLTEARAQLLVCASASCPAEVRTECSLRMDQVTAALPTVVFDAKDGAGHDLAAVKVTMDGQVVATTLDGAALTFNPGTHAFTFEAGGETVRDTLVVREGEKNRHVAVVIGKPVPLAPPAPDAAVAASTPVAPIALPVAPPANESDAPHGALDRRVLGLALGGAGVAGLVVGGVFGGLTLSTWSSAKGECPSHVNCPSGAVTDRSHALTYSTVSDVGFIAGGVLAAAGVTLYLTAPKRPSTMARLTIAPGRLVVGGTF